MGEQDISLSTNRDGQQSMEDDRLLSGDLNRAPDEPHMTSSGNGGHANSLAQAAELLTKTAAIPRSQEEPFIKRARAARLVRFAIGNPHALQRLNRRTVRQAPLWINPIYWASPLHSVSFWTMASVEAK